MTTIVYRDGILAADTRAYAGDSNPIGTKQKIYSLLDDNGMRISFGISTAAPGLSEEIRNWFFKDRHPDFEPQLGERGFTALEIRGDEVYYYKDSFTPSGPLTADYFAIGSGQSFALGALTMGADARTAVEVAGMNDIWTNDKIVHIVHAEHVEDDEFEDDSPTVH